MISYLGNFGEDATVYIMFNTFSSDDPSASCTITNFVNTDIHIHKDDGLTQRNNAAGITVSVDFDGITGSHMVKIDTSDNTVAGFWVVGHEYFVRIEGTTIDGATINSVIGQFSIENRFNEVDVVKWLGTAAATPTVAGVPEVDITHMAGGVQTVTDLKDFADTGYNPVDHKIQGVVLADTTTTNTDRAVITTTVSTSNTASSFTCAGGAASASAYKGMIIEVTDAGDGNTETRRLDAWTSGRVVIVDRDFSFIPAVDDVVRILPFYADINVQAISGDSAAANNLELAFDGTGYGFANCTMPTVTTLTGHTAQTGDSFARIGATGSGLTSLAAAATALLNTTWTDARAGYLDELAAANLPSDIDTLLTRITAAVALASVCTETRLAELDAANIPTTTDNILEDTGTDGVLLAATATSAQLVDDTWDELITGALHNIATSAGRRLRELGAYHISSGTAQAGSAHSITLDAGETVGDHILNRNLIVIQAGTGAGQTRTIVDYNGTTKVAVIDRDWVTNPDATSEYSIIPDDTPLVANHGVATTGTSTTITISATASAINDTYVNSIIQIMAGTGAGQSQVISGYNGTTKVVTVCTTWITTPDNTSVYVILPYGVTNVCNIAPDALALINTECDTALTDYDPPTRTEATADKDAIITEVNANETKIDALNDITVADIIAGIADGSYDLQEMMRIMFAALSGKSSGGGTTTLTFQDPGDAKARITAIVNSSGDRTAMTLDAT